MRKPATHLRGEDEYAHELDAAILERAARRAQAEEKRHRLEESIHVHEPAVVDALLKLGFDDKDGVLLFIAPLVQVAWAAGAPTRVVRQHILTVANRRGVETNSQTYEKLAGWLRTRPPAEFFEGTLSAIAAVLEPLAFAERDDRREALLDACRESAAVHCRLLSWSHRICAAKRRAIAAIRQRLEESP